MNCNLFRFMMWTTALSWPEQFCQRYIPKDPRQVIFMDSSIIAPWSWVSETGRLFFTDILKSEGEIRILQGVSVAFVSVSCTEYIICSYNKNTRIYSIQDIINYAKMWEGLPNSGNWNVNSWWNESALSFAHTLCYSHIFFSCWSYSVCAELKRFLGRNIHMNAQTGWKSS